MIDSHVADYAWRIDNIGESYAYGHSHDRHGRH